MRYFFEHCGVAVFAVTGVLAAENKRVDLFGVVVLALVTALGGGTMRDLILGTKPFWLSDSSFVLTAAATAVATFLAARWRDAPGLLLLVLDACGLALFSIVGTEKALAATGSITVGVMMGVITGVAGGIIRDVLTGEVPLVLRAQTYLYATAALCGSLVYVVLAKVTAAPLMAESVGIGVILSLRLIAMRWRLRLPEFRMRRKE